MDTKKGFLIVKVPEAYPNYFRLKGTFISLNINIPTVGTKQQKHKYPREKSSKLKNLLVIQNRKFHETYFLNP